MSISNFIVDMLGIFIGFPILALLPATLFAYFYVRSKRGALLVAAVAWLAYFPYEQAMKLRILCTGECNLRVDLLLFYPLLFFVTVMAARVFRNFQTNPSRLTEAGSSRRQVSALHWLRWLLLVPTGFVGWYVGFITALVIFQAHKALCPTRYLVSDMCHAPWSSWVEAAAIIIGSFLAGGLVVLLPELIAPDHRQRVAWLAYGVGLLCSIYFLVLLPSIWNAALSSAIGGGAILWRFMRTDYAASKATT